MANFKSVYTAIIDADGTGAVREFGKISQAADKANTKAGKSVDGLKGKISGFVSSLGPAAIAGGLATAGAAIGAFAAKSVGAFQDLGVEVGKFRDSTGLAAEQASGFVELAGDLGINAGSLEGAIGKMNKVAGTTPGVFAAAGIEIARTADGAFNANQTFLNTVDVLSNIPDPARRAALASQIFGKSYQGVAEIIFGGSERIRESFDSLSKQKTFDDDKIAKAQQLRDAFNALSDKVEDLQLSLGEDLAPALLNVLHTLENISEIRFGNLGKVGDILGSSIKGFEALSAGAEKFTGIFSNQSIGDAIAEAQEKAAAPADAMAARWAGAAKAAYELEQNEKGLAAVDLADKMKADADAARELAEAQGAAAAAILETIDAAHSAADAFFAVDEANRDFGESLANVDKVAKDSDSTIGDYVDAVDQARQSAVDLADSAVRLYSEQTKAAGGVEKATDKVNLQNQSLLNSAKTASGPVRDAIAKYITKLNQIPPEKASKIEALINQGKLAEAERELNSASRTRSSAITADAYTGQAERDLNNVARDRTARIQALVDSGNYAVRGRYASGTPSARPGMAIVGEQGPELVSMRGGERVFPAWQTRNMLGGKTYVDRSTTNVYAPAGGDVSRYLREQRRSRKRNGS